MAPSDPVPRRIARILIAVALLSGCVATPRTRPDSASLTGSTIPPPTAARAAWTPIGFSVEHRPLLATQEGSGPVRIYLIGGVHGDETEGRSALDYLWPTLRATATIRVLRDLNPDGTAANRRVNARGFDLNRDWPALNFGPGSSAGEVPLSEPETYSLAQDLRGFRPDLVIVLHSSQTGPFVNYDGPAAAQAQAFAEAARSIDPAWQVQPDIGYPTPGSLGSYLGVDQNIPILTIEFRRGQDEATARAALQKGLSALVSADPLRSH